MITFISFSFPFFRKENATCDAVMDDSEPVYLERLSHSIFDTCGGTLHIKQKKVSNAL